MEQKLRRCCVCGTEYKYCNKCDADAKKPTWFLAFCSENCKNIYDATSKYEDKNIETEEAFEILSKLDLSRLDKFGLSYKKSIKSINDMMECLKLTDKAVSKDPVDTKKIKYVSKKPGKKADDVE